MGIGPIPWDRIVQYADRYGLEPDVSEAFVEIIREADNGYLKHVGDQKPAPEDDKKETRLG